MKVKEIMSHHPHSIAPDKTVQIAAKAMKDLEVGILPVSISGDLLGVITDRDIVLRNTAAGNDPGKVQVKDIMTTPTAFCYEDDPVESAASAMKRKRIKRLCVLDDSDKLAGMITLGDMATKAKDRDAVYTVTKDVLKVPAG